jgi:hypothetical protein
VSNPVWTTTDVSLISIDDVWTYDESGSDLGTAWREPGYDDSAWSTGPGVLAAEDDVLPAPIQTTLTTGIITYYFRRHVTIQGDPADASVEMATLIDDGAVVYVNGTEVLRLGLPEGDVAFDTRANRGVGNAQFEGPFIIPSDLLVSGDNLVAVEVHQISPTNSDVVFGLTLDARFTSTTAEVAHGLALLDGLRITEIMYNPALGQGYEFIELQNISGKALDLTGVRIEGGIDFTFGPMMLGPGEYVVVVENLAAFESRYGGLVNVAGQYDGRLSNGGEELDALLPAPYDSAALRFAYDDQWYPLTDGSGYSLVIVDPEADPSSWMEPESWQTSLLLGGSPGAGPSLPGDFNSDGGVDGDDFLAWEAGFGIQTGAMLSDGDGDGDGDVDGDDFLIWQSNFGAVTAAGGGSAAPAPRRSGPHLFDSSKSRNEAVDKTFAELDRLSARPTERSLRGRLRRELKVFK